LQIRKAGGEPACLALDKRIDELGGIAGSLGALTELVQRAIFRIWSEPINLLPYSFPSLRPSFTPIEEASDAASTSAASGAP